MKTIHAGECSTLKMVSGNENKIERIIDDGTLKEWVGIGWINLRPATDIDKERYPTVRRD